MLVQTISCLILIPNQGKVVLVLVVDLTDLQYDPLVALRSPIINGDYTAYLKLKV